LTLDGFSSQLNVPSAMQVLYDHKILVVKEEGDASETNQAYDQSVAKQDKANIRHLLNTTRMRKAKITQWDLIATCVVALVKTKKTAWVSSFRKVNLHPDYHVSFEEWLDKIRDKIETGERFYKERPNRMFDSLPAMWTNISIENRQGCIQLIDSMQAEKEEGKSIWLDKCNIRKLLKFVALDDLTKIRACYMVAKKHPEVIVGAESSSESPELVAYQQKQLQSFKEFKAVALFPSDIIEEYRCNKSCAISQMKLFQHMTNRVARDHWKSDRAAPLQPSAWLDAVITCEQKALLAPTPADIARASIINETIGEGAKKKIAKRRINFIDGNITSYSRLLNSSEQLTSMQEINSLTAIIGEIRTEREHEKSERASAKASEERKAKTSSYSGRAGKKGSTHA